MPTTLVYAQTLSLVQEVQEGERVDGLPHPLHGIASVTQSPDGRHLYVAASKAGVLSHYTRDLESGRLTLREVYGDDPSQGDLHGAYLVRSSADGQSVYAVGASNRIVVYRRDPADGRLVFVVEEESYLPAAMNAFVVSPDGRNAYASVDGHSGLGVGSDDIPALVSFTRDARSGRLSFLNGLKVVGGGGYQAHFGLQFDPSGAHLYVRTLRNPKYGSYQVMRLRRDPQTGALLSASEVSCCYNLKFSADGRYAFGFDDTPPVAAVFVYRRNGERLEIPSAVYRMKGRISGLATSADGRHVYVGDRAGTIHLLRNDDGTLTPFDTLDTGPAVQGSFFLSPDDRFLSVLLPDENGIAVYARDPDTGRLRPVEVKTEEAPTVKGLRDPRDVEVRADGRFVFALSAGDTVLSVFERDEETGRLRFVEAFPLRLTDGRSLRANGFAVSPDGRHVYVNEGGPALLVLASDPVTGRLVVRQERTDRDSSMVKGPAIEVSPDGRQVLVGFADEQAAQHGFIEYDRDIESGLLAFRQLAPAGKAPVSDVAISHDGRNVYAAGGGGWGHLQVFRRRPEGALAFEQAIYVAPEVEISPDGKQVYTARDGQLTVYQRAQGMGLLTVDMSLDVLSRASNLEISPDGRLVYVGLAVFHRDLENGRVTLLSNYHSHKGQAGFKAMSISPDGRHLYATSRDVLMVFETRLTTVGKEPQQEQPKRTGAMAVFPHPVSGTAMVEFSLPGDEDFSASGGGGDIELALYDLLGRRLRTLHQGWQPAGANRLPLDAARLSSGTYLLRLSGDGVLVSLPVVVLR